MCIKLKNLSYLGIGLVYFVIVLFSMTITAGAYLVDNATAELDQEINSVSSKLSNSVVGTDQGQYPQSAANSLNVAVNAAKVTYNEAIDPGSDTTLEEVNKALEDLKSAEAIFDASGMATEDTTPPASLKNLGESIAGSSWIKWTWTNPKDPDFAYVRVYIDGKFITDASDDFFIATGLSEGKIYTISIQTMDSSGNINTTLVSDPATTLTSNEDTVNLELLQIFGGSIGGIAVNGNYAYIGQGYSFVVLDVTNPSEPKEIGRLIGRSLISNIVISGNYAYTVDADNSLSIIDVSTASSPKLVGNYDLAGYTNDIVVSGKYVYAVSNVYMADHYHDRLEIVDISVPSSPKSAGIYDLAGSAKGMSVSGNYAYVTETVQLNSSYTTESYFEILDISVPSSPKITGRYDITYAGEVSVSGNYAYVVDLSDGLLIFDISAPSSPKLKSTYTNYVEKVAVSGNYAYLTGSGSLEVVDISDPLFPKYMGSCYPAEWAKDIVVSGNCAYVNAGNNGLVIVSVSTPSSPTIVHKYDVACDILDITISGNYAYVADGVNGLEIFDITEPSAPKLAGKCNTGGYVDGVIVSGNYAYLSWALDGGTTYHYLEIVDISDPSSPEVLSSYSGSVYAVSGNYAYVDNYEGLEIVDISNPSAPTHAGTYDTGRIVDVSGNYAYAMNNAYLEILDISDPSSPERISSYGPVDPIVETANVAVSGNCVYLAKGIYGLEIVDVSDPSFPTNTGVLTGPYVGGVKVLGNYAYINDYSCIKIVDIHNPTSPILAGTYGSNGYVADASDNYVYLLNDRSLSILHLNAVSVDNVPVANAGADKTTTVGSAVVFNGSASTDDKGIKLYSWNFGDGTTTTGVAPTHKYTAAGMYTVTLTVTDTAGQTDADTLQVTVLANDWNPWNDPGSESGEKIALAELQTAIYDWRFGITLSNGEMVDLSRLQGLIYSWRFG